MFLEIDLFRETESSQFDVFPLNFAKVYIRWIDISMNNSIPVDIVDSLCELVKDLPDLVLLYFFIFSFRFGDEILKGPPFTKLHYNVDSIVFAVNLKIKIS